MQKYKIMMTKKLCLTIIWLLITNIFWACNTASSYQSANEKQEAVVEKSARIEPVQNTDNQTKKLIKKGKMYIDTDSLELTYRKIMDLTVKYQVYIAGSQMKKDAYRHTAELDVKIPAAQFDVFIQQLQKQEKNIKDLEIITIDVSEEYLDLQARLKNKKALKDRYLSLYKKAKNITEIMDVEARINRIQTEMDQIEGRLRYMAHRVSYSSLKIYISQPVIQTVLPENKWLKALKNGWQIIVDFVWVLLNIWPLIIIIVFSIVYVKKLYRKKINP